MPPKQKATTVATVAVDVQSPPVVEEQRRVARQSRFGIVVAASTTASAAKPVVDDAAVAARRSRFGGVTAETTSAPVEPEESRAAKIRRLDRFGVTAASGGNVASSGTAGGGAAAAVDAASLSARRQRFAAVPDAANARMEARWTRGRRSAYRGGF